MGARATWICARATRRGARASDVCKGHILCLYTKILIWCKGLIFCLLKFWNILRPLHHFLWPLHMALAPLLVALALALAPRKMLLFSRLSGSVMKLPCLTDHSGQGISILARNPVFLRANFKKSKKNEYIHYYQMITNNKFNPLSGVFLSRNF